MWYEIRNVAYTEYRTYSIEHSVRNMCQMWDTRHEVRNAVNLRKFTRQKLFRAKCTNVHLLKSTAKFTTDTGGGKRGKEKVETHVDRQNVGERSVSRCSRARPALIEKASSLRSLFSSPSSCSRERIDVTVASSLAVRHTHIYTHIVRASIRFILFCFTLAPFKLGSLLGSHIFLFFATCGPRMFSDKKKK